MITIIVFLITGFLIIKNKNTYLKGGPVKILVLIELLGLLVFGVDYLNNRILFDGRLERNAYGDGGKTESLEVTRGKDREKIKVDIDEKSLSQKEKKSYVKKAIKEIDESFLGENESLNQVSKDLVIKKDYADGLVYAAWNFDKEGLIGENGRLKNESIDKSELIQASVILQCMDYEEIYTFSFNLLPADISDRNDMKKIISKKVHEREEDNRNKSSFSLPKSLMGQELTWQKPIERRGELICIMGLLLVIAWPLKDREEARERRKRREEELEKDYPELVRKLSLFVSCGMPIKRAMGIIKEDYKKSLAKKGKERAGYDLLSVAVRAMESGMPEIEAYEMLGKRERIFRKLSGILEQNLKRGSVDVREKLEREALDAEVREKQRIRMEGEKISTRLLGPLFGMLAIIMVVLMVPAVWGMSI